MSGLRNGSLDSSEGASLPPDEIRQVWRLLRWIGIFIALSAVAVFVTRPVVIRSYKIVARTQAVANARQIHMALVEFDEEFGRMPDADTAVLVQKKHGASRHLGTATSNDYFRQLLAAGFGNEKIFYAAIPGVRMPDGRISKDGRGKALEKGECGFAYIPGFSMKSNGSNPIAFTPLKPGPDGVDQSEMKGRAVTLRIDGSATANEIDLNGDLMMFGKPVTDPENELWPGQVPFIAMPDL